MTLNEFVKCYSSGGQGTIDHITINDLDKGEDTVWTGTPKEFLRSRRFKTHDSKIVNFVVTPRFKAHFELLANNYDMPEIHHINTGVEILVTITHLSERK